MNNNFQLVIQQQLADTLIQKAAQLPKNFKQTKFVQNCLSALDSIDGIEDVEPATVVKGLMKGAILGLDFMNRECYLIPYNNKDTGKKDVNFQTDYKGEKKLAKLYSVNPIEEITTEIVRSGDFYEVEVKDNKKFVNWKPKRFNDGEIEGAFCVVLYKDGSSVSSEMSKKEMDEVRTVYSKAKESPAWKNRPSEMYKKTVLRLNLKNVEKVFESPEQLRAYEEASEFEFNKSETNSAPVIKNIYNSEVKQIEKKEPEFKPEEKVIDAEVVTKNEEEEFCCADCNKKISWAENQYSNKHFGKALCRGCQDKIREIKVFLTESNYYSKEANQEYLSVSQYKDFCGTMKKRGCEAKAMAKLRGVWVEEMTEPLLLGSYVDAHFEGTLNLFKAKHPEIFRKKDAELYAKFQKANETIQMLERDEMFMFYMSGEKQTILTAELFGAKWKCKLDSYLKKLAIVDLKYVKDIRERFWVKDEGSFVSFVEWWGYDIQAAIYREIEAICSGGEKLPVYLAAADKKKTPDHEIIAFRDDGSDFDSVLYEVERNVPRILDLKAGKVEPDRCEVCDYCLATKKLTKPVYFRSLIEV